MANINIGGRLHSTATGNVVTGADEVLYEPTGGTPKKQSDVNQETDAALADRYTKSETYNKTQVNQLVSPQHNYVVVETYADLANISEHPEGCVYRVSNYDGTNSQVDATMYSEYGWDGTQYIHLATKSQIGEVFDISAYHATGGTLTTYTDLTDALTGTNGGVPQSLQKGGMSVKFVHTSDNKYVQYRYMSDDATTVATFTNIENWQGVDDVPTAGSENLVKSGGVYSELYEKLDKKIGVNLINPDALTATKAVFNIDGSALITVTSEDFVISDYIPVNGKDIRARAFGAAGNYAYGAVYDANLHYLRGLDSNKYTYQAGDAYVRFSLQNDMITHMMANYGTELLTYQKYTDYAPIDELSEDVDNLLEDVDNLLEDVDNLKEALPQKVDKVESVNLINPANIQYGKYFDKNGYVGNGGETFCIDTEYIRISGNNIISNCYAGVQNIIAGYVIYAEDKTILRAVTTNAHQYNYIEGDYWIRYAFIKNGATSDEKYYAYYGTDDSRGYTPYTVVPGMSEVWEHIDAIEESMPTKTEDISILSQLNYIYETYISSSRNYTLKVWLSHFLSESYKNKNIYFEGDKRELRYVPDQISAKTEENISVNIKAKDTYRDTSISFKRRITPSSLSKNYTPRVLVIGDSVTAGYGSNSNKSVSWLPNQYWAFAKMLFEMDKIDGGDNTNEYNALFVGSYSNGDFTINYNGVTRSVRAKAEGVGGATLNDLFSPTMAGGQQIPNRFYDSVNQTFSVLSYLSKYRTMDDLGVRLVSESANPAGETVTGSDGLSYTIGTEITTQALLASIDVCTPTIIVINMNHNTTLQNYQTYIGQLVSIIKSEVENVKVVIMGIDETGTLFPNDYPNYVASQILYYGLHSKNASIYNYVRQNIEDEENDVFVLGAQFVMPTAQSYPTIDYDSADSILKDDKNDGIKYKNPNVLGQNYHPNNYAHSMWGYELYSIIKWLIS